MQPVTPPPRTSPISIGLTSTPLACLWVLRVGGLTPDKDHCFCLLQIPNFTTNIVARVDVELVTGAAPVTSAHNAGYFPQCLVDNRLAPFKGNWISNAPKQVRTRVCTDTVSCPSSTPKRRHARGTQ